LGDVKPVGEGVFEMREFFGPGWRRYYLIDGDTLFASCWAVAIKALKKLILLLQKP
jgi:putative addiction module killer protein